ncbi:hypothetical protein ASD28_22920 [Massilia sp. Root133]|uniref:hypothetical protein n=1 Tax=unclassified Massilia TaxID=2609279 RepID=UPI0007023CD2|nr:MULTISPECIES: hypothetical protein [unclassified Massilia]KQY15721.1 hypothetical protein ASD28_22920 [Massilia sp. Root133]KQZ44451.1 hypothetical protein ASD92_28285 [Massilia sp. Root1485]
MKFPVVYDVLMRVEIEARDTAEALSIIADDISELGIKKAVKSGFEIIRDDNAHPPKDMHSRNVNGFAVFTSAQKHELVARIAIALEAAGQGDRAPGVQLLESLKAQFAYLDNRELEGVRV